MSDAEKDRNSSTVARWLISKILKENYHEEFLGDLEEIYEDRKGEKGKFYAKLMYSIDTLYLLFGFISISLFKTQNNNTIMIRNMFKIAWRNAIRQKQFTILNMLGLTLGIAAFIMIGLFVYDEATYDTFHSNKDRIYRINQPMIWNNWDEQFSSTGPNVATALREDIPEFEQVTRMLSVGEQIINYRQQDKIVHSFKESKFYAVEENFFDVFTFKILKGSQKDFRDPLNMFMTQETAERYFGYDDPIGKTVQIKHWDGTWITYTVRGVLENVPPKSHIQFDMLVSMSSYQESLKINGWKWIWTVFSTYGLVKEGTDILALSDKIQSVPPKWAPPTTEKIFNQSFDEFTAGKPWRLYLQPLSEIYLSDEPDSHRFGPTGNPQFSKIFSVIGVLVLLLSCINFMNLSTAQSSTRAKEVGIRKVLGSNRKTLIKQFVFESTLFVAASTMTAFLLVEFSLDTFNSVAQKELALMPYLSNLVFIGMVVLFVLLLGLIAGSYPAFYLSSFRPIETLKGKGSSGFQVKGIRNGLVVFQFTISIALIICTFFVQKQLSYASSYDLGFADRNILQIHNIEQMGEETKNLKTRLLANPAIKQVGKSYGIPPNVWSGDRYKAFGPENEVIQFSNLRTEGDYLELLGLDFITGRNFDPARVTDNYSVILNEEAVKILGWGTKETFSKDSPLGKFVAVASGNEDKFEVIGVVKNFNFKSVKEKIEPMIILNQENDKVWDYGMGLSFYSIKFYPETIKRPNDLQSLIGSVEEELTKIDESIPFEYSFMDQEFENTFRSEQRMSSVLNTITFMAIIIASLGLFGLAAFTAEQRIKELGIRKVLGAKVFELVFLFASDFSRLIIIAILLASPIAYFLVDQWLNDFAYKTPIEIWVFAVAGLSALFIALITISYQSLNSAYKNPVETLKNE